MATLKRIKSFTEPLEKGEINKVSLAYYFLLKFSVLHPKLYVDSQKSKLKTAQVFFAGFLLLITAMAIVFVSFRFALIKEPVSAALLVSLIEPTMPFSLLFILRGLFLLRARKIYSILKHVKLCDSRFEVTTGSRGHLVVTSSVVIFTAIASFESYSYLKSLSYGPVMNMSYHISHTKMEYFEKITEKVCNLPATSRVLTFFVGVVIIVCYVLCQLTNLCCELTLTFFGLFIRRGLVKIDLNLKNFVNIQQSTDLDEALDILEDQFQHYRVAVDKMNDTLGILTLGLFIRAISLVASLFFVLQFFGGHPGAAKAVGSWFVSYLLRFLMTTMILAEIPRKVETLNRRLRELSLNPYLTRVIKHRTQIFACQDVSMNGLGFFSVNRSFVAAFLGGTISYLIIIWQFKG